MESGSDLTLPWALPGILGTGHRQSLLLGGCSEATMAEKGPWLGNHGRVSESTLGRGSPGHGYLTDSA